MKEGTKISKDGAVAAAEFLRLFVIGNSDHSPYWVIEAIHRAHLKAENKNIVTAKDVQRILPQLLLDF